MKDLYHPSDPWLSEDSPNTSTVHTPHTNSNHTSANSSDGHISNGITFTQGDRLDHYSREDVARESLNSARSSTYDLELHDMEPNLERDDEEAALTPTTKRERQEMENQRHSLSADGRPSLEDTEDIWAEARRLGKAAFLRKAMINGSLIGLWYLFSICISVYNKWMFSPDNLDFHYPMFVTSLHMIIQFLLSGLVLFLFPRFRPRQAMQEAHEKAQRTNSTLNNHDPSKPIMTPWFYFTRIASTGSVTGLDIGLGNSSLKFVTLTFFTMCKSSTLGFVLFFAILFRLENPSWKIGLIILLMTAGVILMVAGETSFNAVGFSMLMAASFCSGIRWSLTQILLRRTPATSNPFSTLFFLTPSMFFALFILAIPMEGFSALKTGIDVLVEKKGFFLGFGILLFPGCLAFCMVSAEFALLKRTSVVTLSVCGIFKEVLTITAAGLIFGDQLTPINISGVCVTILAIVIYNWLRMQKMKKQEVQKAVENMEQAAPVMGDEFGLDDPDSDDQEGLLGNEPTRESVGSTGVSRELQSHGERPLPALTKRRES